MNDKLLLFVAILFAFANADSSSGKTMHSEKKVWFDVPAENFTQSCPLGNGGLGAMIFGGVSEERVVLNESGMWSSSLQDADRPEAAAALPEIRRLSLEGKNVEAEQSVNANFTCADLGSCRVAHRIYACFYYYENRI